MLVAVIDIGSNTARLLVAGLARASVETVHEERALLALGDEIERFGRLSDLKLSETAARARGYARRARELGSFAIDVIVTAPGRQSENADELLAVLRRATGVPARVLSADEEGRLAYEGALAQTRFAPKRVAVCDVGGGSTEVVIGTRATVDFCCSLDIGSLRVARRFLGGDPPGKRAVAAARYEIATCFDSLEAPPVDGAMATGGSARSLRKLAGSRTLGERELASLVKTISKRTSSQIARDAGLDPIRAQTLLGGALILAEAQKRLGVPLEVARGGLREGAAYAMLTRQAAA